MGNTEPLRLGMFVMPIHDPRKPLAQCIDEDLELAVKCEELGFDDLWVGEHHSSSVENIVMPEIFLAKVLGRRDDEGEALILRQNRVDNTVGDFVRDLIWVPLGH